MSLNPFRRQRKDTVDESIEVSPDIVSESELKSTVQDGFKQAVATEVEEKIRLLLSADRHESHEIKEEIIPPVITIGTELDKVDELTGEIQTKTDKWRLWLEYHGTKGRVSHNEVPMFEYGHMGAILPNLRNMVYRMTYDIDEKTGELKRDSKGKAIVTKKERILLPVELANLKARLNLAEDGYARGQQRDVTIGAVGQVNPYKQDGLKDLTQALFGKRER